jgi:tetratricopeptide (TPR) repeat protein
MTAFGATQHPNQVLALMKQALALHQAGQIRAAESLYRQVLAVAPNHPDALHLLGLAALQTGDLSEAVELIRKAATLQPRNGTYQGNLANALFQLGNYTEAIAAYRQAAKINPDEPRFPMGIANCDACRGDRAGAEAQLRRLLKRHPRFALAWFNLGNTVREQGRPEEAIDPYRRAIHLDPALADAHNGLGAVLHALGRLQDAEDAYRQHLAMQPDSLMGYCNLASVLIDRGRFSDAATLCRREMERFAESPDLRLMLGSALAYQGDLIGARGEFRAAATLAPESPRALWGLGLALLESGNAIEGLDCLERALGMRSGSPELRHSMAGVYLSQGDLQSGWQEYYWRPARGRFAEKVPGLHDVSNALGNISGKRIALLREQGLGDELFFLRFAAVLKSKGVEITYRADAKIASLLERVPALDQVITADAPLPLSDLTLLLGDLPQVLGTLDSSPRPPRELASVTGRGAATRGFGFLRALKVFYPEIPAPLALTSMPEQVEKTKQRLAQLGPAPYLGLTWRAGTAPEEQRGMIWMLHKEIPLEQLGAALRGTRGTLLALQRKPAPGEIEKAGQLIGRPLHDLCSANEDLEVMLALLSLIDDYVGVSNTNMHLRAAAGRAAHVLLPCPAEWRWMAVGDESPWFPGFRIYRQKPDGSWNEAIERLGADLLTAFGSRK